MSTLKYSNYYYYIKLFFSLLVLLMGTLKLRLFLRLTLHVFGSGSKLCNLWFLLEHISLNRLSVRASLRLWGFYDMKVLCQR